MMDIKGRQIRTSKFESEHVTYKMGEKFEIRTDSFDIISTKDEI